jgi:hypothetical protein
MRKGPGCSARKALNCEGEAVKGWRVGSEVRLPRSRTYSSAGRVYSQHQPNIRYDCPHPIATNSLQMDLGKIKDKELR